MNSENNRPLCVDLDGTLLNTDTLVESALLLAKANPLNLLWMIVWLLSGGKANLKEQIAQRVAMDPVILPYNEPFIAWLREQAAVGRELVLVTAANQRIADAVAAHLQLFDTVIATNASHNLSKESKRDELCRRYGEGGYDYAGNSSHDLPVWSGGHRAILVNTPPSVRARAVGLAEVEAEFPMAHTPLKSLLRAMRPHQWSKNLLVFVSILIAQAYTDVDILVSTVIAFLSFCLCSSSVYLINDLLDLSSDRNHKEKCHRPFASGQVPLILGILLAPVLLLAAIILALLAGGQFPTVLGIYFFITLAYSFYLKRLVLIDVLVLACLYTLRIIAGASVMDSLPSVWLTSFSVFVFTSLAMAKRYAELKSLETDEGTKPDGRGYHVGDLAIVAQLGTASGYISVLVLALYIDTPGVMSTYSDHRLMWLLCPLLMYWIGRIWLLSSRGQMDQDPVVFATRDKPSYCAFLIGFAILVAAL